MKLYRFRSEAASPIRKSDSDHRKKKKTNGMLTRLSNVSIQAIDQVSTLKEGGVIRNQLLMANGKNGFDRMVGFFIVSAYAKD